MTRSTTTRRIAMRLASGSRDRSELCMDGDDVQQPDVATGLE